MAPILALPTAYMTVLMILGGSWTATISVLSGIANPFLVLPLSVVGGAVLTSTYVHRTVLLTK